MSSGFVDELSLDAINARLGEAWERMEQISNAAVPFTLPTGAKMWLDRASGEIRVQYSDGTIETWSKD